ncbi:Nif11-like leader peptide family natural product precursor [Elusimicrobiota bacterium]
MSVESARAFLEKMKSDKAFAQKFAACKDDQARIALVKAEGFEFTGEEIEGAFGELSEEDLAGVSGGKISPNNYKINTSTATI